MKLTQKKCRMRLPKMKSANALVVARQHYTFVSIRHHPPPPRNTYLSCEIPSNSALFSAFVWILKLAVSTNCPTVAENPDRKALKGYIIVPCLLVFVFPFCLLLLLLLLASTIGGEILCFSLLCLGPNVHSFRQSRSRRIVELRPLSGNP